MINVLPSARSASRRFPVPRLPVAARILIGLVAGLAAGYFAGPENAALPAFGTIGGLWLDALRMPIIPLVFALVLTGLGGGTDVDGSTRSARRAIVAFAGFLLASAVFGVSFGAAMFSDWQVAGLDAVRGGTEKLPPLPPLGDTLRALVPVNPIGSAASGAIVPVVLFALIFAVALRHIDRPRAAAITELFRGVADTLLVIIGWVLLLAPIGVFALAFDVAARSGLAVGALLAWYVLARIIGGIALAAAFVALVGVFGRTPLRAFLRAALPAQSVAFSTQSSLASLPAMLQASRTLGLPERQVGTVLPLAVALFRISAPTAISLAVLALARLNGIDLGLPQIMLVAILAVLNNLVIAGLPNQISFFAAYAPVALAVGVPIDLLPLFLAVDTIPDMFATSANVTADLALATLLTERSAAADEDLAP
ncbi:dicarboxylate/amino acid:cation symporter [Sphingomonas beigongshangi]|uniref:dicarboxylate/amino acid:cation symporter n=1 Tax=Sphingomonas beigongshangi TaxID=2782540 RepID=UPI001AED7B8A|nr:cation:dicarboxylase symporter family transporter [Sphingomonas beigongshangi]